MISRSSTAGAWITMLLLSATGSPLPAQELVGSCFDTTLGEWEAVADSHSYDSPVPPPPEERSDSLYHSFPLRLQLTDLDPVVPWGGGSHRFVVPEGALPVPMPFLRWEVEDGRMTISASGNFTGTVAELERQGDAWAGPLRTWTDMFDYQLYERSVELREVDCTSPPPLAASADIPLLRELPLDGGPPLRLAERLPDAYVATTHPIRSWEWIDGATPAGYWAGADSVFVNRTAEGLIERIEVRYPDDFDASAVWAGLVAELGAPLPGLSSWMNRSTYVFIRRDYSPKVLLRDPRLEYH